MSSKQDVQRRAMVSKMSREELEDHHLRMSEENSILKAHGRKQEEKIKKMATKLVRLVNDRKREVAHGSAAKRSSRDVELEETIENQQDLIRKINKENNLLKQKLHVMQQQLQTNKRSTPYNNVTSKINTGRSPKPSEKHESSAHGKHTSQDRSSTRSMSPSRYGHSLLEESRNENHHLREQIIALQNNVASMQDENDALHQQIRKFHADHENDVLKFHEHINSTQRSTVGENIGLIKLQRQMKEKSNNFTEMETRFHKLQTDYNQLRRSYEKVLDETEKLKTHLLDEESRSISLQNQLKHGSSHQQKVGQQQEQIRELEKEVEILKDANERLLESAFDQEKEHQWRQLERKLRVQIAQLEAAVKSDAADKLEFMDKMDNKNSFVSRMHSDSRKVHEEGARLRKENEDLRERLRLYTMSDDIVDVNELREALAKVRQKKHAKDHHKRPDFLENIDDENKDPESMFMELQCQHAETIQELEKTREMLIMQHKINKDYQIEVETVSSQMEEMKREYEIKLDRFARLLDARAARLKKLELQLHDVAYGTKQFKISSDSKLGTEEDELDETIHLERGENLFEIYIAKLSLSKEALIDLDDREPSLFVTYAFYDYELVSTPILKSSSPLFAFTAQFIVKVDDLFLHHLQKEYTIFEVHQALGVEHNTVAACKIRFNELLGKPQGKLHGSVAVTGFNGSNYGSLDYWVRLRVPMDQAIRLYKERTKALGYLSANTTTTQKTLDSLDSEKEISTSSDNTNQLFIQVISCNHVQSRRSGIQPSIYCVYKFFDFADHDTPIIPNSNNPHFDDRQAYPLLVNAHLDAYLKSEKLLIYVFDDTDPDVSSYLGKAVIDLIPLAHNKLIKAPFQLTRSNGDENGTIEVALRWQLEYRSPAGLITTQTSTEEEEEIKETEHLIKRPPVTPQKRTMVRSATKPFTASTPKPSKLSADDTTPVQPTKRVSIIEPEKEKPTPVARKTTLTTPKKSIEEQKDEATLDEESEDSVISAIQQVKTMEEATVDEVPTDENEDTSKSPVPDSEKPAEEDIEEIEELLKSEEEKDEEESFTSELEGDTEKRTYDDLEKVATEQENTEMEEGEKSDEEVTEEIEEIPDDYEEDEFEDANKSDTVDDVSENEQVTNKQEEEEQQEEEVDSASITVSVKHLTLNTNTSIWDDVEQVFVEYDFLGSVKEMEDSVAIPTSKDEKILINFDSVTNVDKENNKEQRGALSDMLKTGQSSFKFTVVSDPINDDGTQECEEIGAASVDIASILQNNRNLSDYEIPVESLKNPPEIIGNLNVDVKALHVLKAIQRELKARLEEHDS
uniref:Protein fantom n=1 Tax=Phallusia mammillata TaxID=59560 RepID=A0A6F9DRN1_9ASCI|nr:protein fantom [Phallusia mammillata]